MTTIGREVSRAEFDRLKAKYQRWGRWGADDELGALNAITPASVVAAASLVRTGRVFSLAHPIGAQGPSTLLPPRFAPVYRMSRSGDDVRRAYDAGATGMQFTDDMIVMPLQTSTHWDALSHVFHDRTMYNGRDTDHVLNAGARASAITVTANKMVGRGVLLDVPALDGREVLEIGEAIEAEDLQACCERQEVQVQPGDFVLIRTGRMGRSRALGEWGPEWSAKASTGIGVSAVDWLCDHDIAGVAADNFSVEIIPAQTAHFGELAPMHVILLQGAGIYVGEFWVLDELAADCAADGTYEFMLVSAPLMVDGAVGSACNPQAIK